jgi:hypothetical protein
MVRLCHEPEKMKNLPEVFRYDFFGRVPTGACVWPATGCKIKKNEKVEKDEKKCYFFGANPLFFCQSKRFFGSEIYKLLSL